MRKIKREPDDIATVHHKLLRKSDNVRSVSRNESPCHMKKKIIVDNPGDPENVIARYRSGRARRHLIKKRNPVAESSVRERGNCRQRIRFDRRALGRRDRGEPLDNTLDRDSSKIISLTTRDNGRRDPVRLRRRENKYGVGRRFLERLEECVERSSGKHMNLVDNINLISRTRRKIHNLIADAADIVDAVVRRGVHLDHVKKRVVENAAADFAGITGISVDRRKAIDRAGEDLGDRSLAGPSGSAKEIGMTDLPRDDGLTKRADRMLLLDNLIERQGSKLTVQRDVSHVSDASSERTVPIKNPAKENSSRLDCRWGRLPRGTCKGPLTAASFRT